MTETPTKTCFRCRLIKPFDEFGYQESCPPTYRRGICKECYATRRREHYAANPVESRRIVRDGIAKRLERRRAQWRAQKARNADRRKELDRIRRSRPGNKIRGAARSRLRYAILQGRIQKPTTCQECGAGGHIHGHHEDYSKPLEVSWLCVRCHGIKHRKDAAA